MEILQNFIDGAFRPFAGNAWLETSNPYTGEVWARMPRSGANEVAAAVSAARRAFETGPWATMTATARGHILRRMAQCVADNAAELARIEVRDNGKTYREMHAQLQRVPDWYHYYAGLADKADGRLLPPDRPDMMTYVRHEPLGVIGMITPWNSPLMLLAWKLAPALATGNTAVVKPSEFTSASALRFAELMAEAGLPAGVLNVVTGLGSEAGAALTAHPDVAKIAFTGGGEGGRAVYAAAAHRLKPVSLELGGKSPNIVFSDADLDLAAKGVVAGIFGSGGQSCVAGSRLLAHHEIHDALLERITALTARIRLGDPMSPETDIGPVANRAQFDRIVTLVEKGKAEGARLAIGGHPVAAPEGAKGLFFAPTVFADVRNDMRIAQEEVFGPVLCALPFGDEAEALAIANDTDFGLGAGVWTRDLACAHRMAAGIRAGSIWVNTYKLTSPLAPFGGFKASGLGREGGEDAIAEFTQAKSVWINLGSSVAYGFPT